MRLSARVWQDVRVRFAPSPTGRLHLGSLRTALFNYLFARKHNGAFILRIEDTDRSRLVPGCAEKFEETLDTFGLKRDESPVVGGAFGSYTQSERGGIYAEYSERLIDSGHCYRCFCSSERLDILRKGALRAGELPRYDNRCRSLSKAESDERARNGEPSVVRFRFDKQNVAFHDAVYGSNSQVVDEGDFVVMKSDGFPTYHFANVVDDRLMAISHVIRGAEWLASTPKHVKLYEAFDWTPPRFVHLPLITRDGKKKLSKRDADAYVDYYIEERGYLPAAVLNFLLRNGSGITGFQPSVLYSLEELVHRFDVDLIGTRDFMMDRAALDTYGRLAFHSTPRETLLEKVAKHLKTHATANIDPTLLEPAYIQRVIDFICSNEENFAAFDELVSGDFSFFFGRPSSAAKLLERFDAPTALQICNALLAVKQFDIASVKAVAKQIGMKPKEVMAATRCALIDSFKGPPLSELFGFFSDDECRTRIQFLREVLKDATASAEAC